MLYVWIHKDLSKDNYYHIENCQIIESARNSDPTIYKHTSREIVMKLELKLCPKCRPDEFKRETKLVKEISKSKEQGRKMSLQIQETVLLTGAGFTHNFGGFLADEMWAEIFNHLQVQSQEGLKEIMLEDFNYESVYYKVLHYKRLFDNEADRERKKVAITEAVMAVYDKLDAIVRKFRFTTDTSYPVDIYGVQKLINRFAGRNNSKGFFFTLNQDLFIERHYYNGVKPTLPGMHSAEELFSSDFSHALRDTDYRKLPTQDELNKCKSEWLSSGDFFYIKLHGSQNWTSSTGSKQIVIGMDKRRQIHNEPLLSWYFEIFKEVMFQPMCRLLVIGYGFSDDHINQIIVESIQKSNLRLYILSPVKPKDFKERLLEMPRGKYVWKGLYGYFPYNLKQVFPKDQSISLAFQCLNKNYFESL